MSALSEKSCRRLKDTEPLLLEEKACSNVIKTLTVVTVFSRTSVTAHGYVYRAV